MKPPPKAATGLATSTPDDIYLRGLSLSRDLIGEWTLTEAMLWQLLGRVPSAGQIAVVDACMVSLMEHGLTPSALATRLIYGSTPEAMQGAVAAGLLGVGGTFVGTVEGCGALLERIAGAGDPAAEAAAVADEHRAARQHVPGFGHPTHKPDDPRSPRLLEVARQHGVAGARVRALELLASAVDRAAGKHITINATGAVAAVLLDAEIPAGILRGIVLVARCAGLVGHVLEEQQRPAMKSIWAAAEAAVPYETKLKSTDADDNQRGSS